MKISGKMKIYIFHGDDLGISATGSSAFNSEYRTQRRFTKCNGNIFSYSFKSIRKTNSCSGLSFSCRSRTYCGNENKFSVFSVGFFKKRRIDLCLISSILLNIFFIHMRHFAISCAAGSLNSFIWREMSYVSIQ